MLIEEFDMVDEIATMQDAATAPADAAPANAPVQKKTRAPRKPKAIAEPVSTSVSAPAKKRGRRKSSEKSGEAASATQPAKRGPGSSVAATLVSDGFVELRELEAENQKLRKALGDKLRGENADLRKKLGMA